MKPFESSDLTDAECMLRVIEQRLTGLVTTIGAGDWYVFYDPDGRTAPERRFPFCTLMTGDRYDAASCLDRDASTYRVNLGVSRRTYERRFGPAPRQAAGYDVIDSGFDYTATDTVMPHPFYAPLHWVCVVNPGERTSAELAELLVEAHGIARRAYDNHRDRRG
ncbi:MAG: DUF6194 family protein [Candidatus Nanopelagicales bacterium]